MWNLISGRLDPQSAITSTFAASLVLSLLCSLSIEEGHADATIAATAEAIQPLQAGDPAPRFVVRTVADEAFVFDPQNLERPALIVTFRGGWCPYCNIHLSELRHVLPDVAALGVDVLFLSGDRPEILYTSLADDTQADVEALDYQIYSDADAEAAIALGIAFDASPTAKKLKSRGRDIEASSMARHNVLSVPAVYAVDRQGAITFAFVEADYRVRLPADDLLTAARETVQ